MSVKSCVTIRSQILQRLTTISGHGIEDAALSLLALRNSGADPHALLGTQHRSGAWSALPNIEPLSAFHTALALLAIRPFQTASVRHAADRAFEWLSELRGLESHWLWQWKFRLFDNQVRFDPVEIRVAVGSWYRELGRSYRAFHLGVSGMAPGVPAHRAR